MAGEDPSLGRTWRKEDTGRDVGMERRMATLERVVSLHQAWFEEMGVPEASGVERHANVNVWRWWIRGEESRRDRRRFLATVAAVAGIFSAIVSVLVLLLGQLLHVAPAVR